MKARSAALVTLLTVFCGCGGARTTSATPSPSATPTTSSATPSNASMSAKKSFPPEQVCERLRRLAVRAGAKGAGIEQAVAHCQDGLVELRGEDPRAYACTSRCMMIAPGAEATGGCEDLCDPHADESCVDMRKEDPTLGDAEIDACRKRVDAIQDVVDEKTILCALGCTQMADAMVEMDGCFRRCL